MTGSNSAHIRCNKVNNKTSEQKQQTQNNYNVTNTTFKNSKIHCLVEEQTMVHNDKPPWKEHHKILRCMGIRYCAWQHPSPSVTASAHAHLQSTVCAATINNIKKLPLAVVADWLLLLYIKPVSWHLAMAQKWKSALNSKPISIKNNTVTLPQLALQMLARMYEE